MTITMNDGAPVAADRQARLSGSEERTLEAIFRHPLSHSVAWRDVLALLAAIGTADEQHNGEVSLRAGGERLVIKPPHGKDLEGGDVIDLRHFLTRAGWSPNAAGKPSAVAPAVAQALVVVIDHAGARIYALGADTSDEAAPDHETHHFRHELEARSRDADREESWPRDERFFEEIARALAAGGPIVIIGHGKGQSNEGGHLCAYLEAHHKPITARIVREIVADLPHMSTPELLDLGRQVLGETPAVREQGGRN